MSVRLPRPGAIPLDERRTRFCVWAPRAPRLALHLPDQKRNESLSADTLGYHTLITEAPIGTLYQYAFDDGRTRPDPASRAQPFGVDGPSMVERIAAPGPLAGVPTTWLNPPLHRHVIYELHVGTFTPQGTFEAIIPRLEELRSLGITAIELMPIAQFPGERNWGYDGVNLFAAQWSYGGLNGVRQLIAAAHAVGLAVFLDVVYNHLGPEGNFLGEFGPYFTDRYKTPWGQAINFDGSQSDHVREFFIQNALHWTIDVGFDGLRLDAVHAINDQTARPFLQELSQRVRDSADHHGRRVLLIAESHDNDPRLIRCQENGGFGLDGCWNDDYHHAVRAALTGERSTYYRPFGAVSQIAKAVRDRFVFTGEFNSFFARRHGAPAADVPHSRLIVFTQNHDQVGNRPFGDRLDSSAGPDGVRVAAALVLLSPFTPMLWMGEEHAEPAPFAYFISHSGPALIEAVRKGRRADFPDLPRGAHPPDPQADETFQAGKLNWSRREKTAGAQRLAYYTALLRLRRELDLSCSTAAEVAAHAWDDRQSLAVIHGCPPRAIAAANLGQSPAEIEVPLPPLAQGWSWTIVLDSGDKPFGGEAAQVTIAPQSTTLRIALPPRTAAVLAAQGEGP